MYVCVCVRKRVYVRVYVCVCVCEREREREKEKRIGEEREKKTVLLPKPRLQTFLFLYILHYFVNVRCIDCNGKAHFALLSYNKSPQRAAPKRKMRIYNQVNILVVF